MADSFKKYMGELAEAMRQELPDVSDTRAEFMIDGVPYVFTTEEDNPSIFVYAGLGPLLPDDEEEQPKVERPKVEQPKVGQPKVEPPKVEVGKAKNVGGAEIPKITSQEEFVNFFKSLTVTSKFGSVSEDDAAIDANGDKRKTFTYQGLVFRGATRAPDDPSLAEGFKSQNDLSVPEHRTEAMGLGAKADNGVIGGQMEEHR